MKIALDYPNETCPVCNEPMVEGDILAFKVVGYNGTAILVHAKHATDES